MLCYGLPRCPWRAAAGCCWCSPSCCCLCCAAVGCCWCGPNCLCPLPGACRCAPADVPMPFCPRLHRLPQDVEVQEQIERDVARTHPDMHFFSGEPPAAATLVCLSLCCAVRHGNASGLPCLAGAQHNVNASLLDPLIPPLCFVHSPRLRRRPIGRSGGAPAADAASAVCVCQAEPGAAICAGEVGEKSAAVGVGDWLCARGACARCLGVGTFHRRAHPRTQWHIC